MNRNPMLPVRSQPARLQSVPLPYFRPEALHLLSLLSSQREIVYQQILHIIIVAEQEMSAMKTQVPLGNGVKLPRVRSPHFNLTQSVPPSLQPSKAVSFIATSVLPDKERLPSPSPSPSGSSLSSLESLEIEKIPMPPGEVDRPGRGGYDLEEHFKWTDNEICELKMMLLAAQRLSELLASSGLNPPSSQVPFIKALTKALKRILRMHLYVDHLLSKYKYHGLHHGTAAMLLLNGPPVHVPRPLSK
ncbi:hypothetical protein EDC04DRAFT_2901524 [Pisolithus marmoratus]|nr:hypothetical protein EDC04DRAFT_2901524 [Pisolithus marmoratus]